MALVLDDFLIQFLMGTAPQYAALVLFGITLYKVNQMAKSLNVLNHNSSVTAKALLAAGLLKPEDLKDVLI